MSSFTTDLITRDLGDGKRVQVMQGFEYRIGRLGSPDFVCVPTAFIFNYASSPWGFWNLYPRFGKTNKGSCVHDYLNAGGVIVHEYWLQPNDPSAPPRRRYTVENPSRGQADGIYLEANGVTGVNWLQRYGGHATLRLTGWVAWRKGHKPAVVAQTRALEAADPNWPWLPAVETPRPNA